MAKLGINQDSTRMIDSLDPSTFIARNIALLTMGHNEAWSSTADEDDETDPTGDGNIRPPLYRGITSEAQLLKVIERAYTFWEQHPHFQFKSFPQDHQDPSLVSTLFTSDDGSRSLSIKVRVGQYTTSERQVARDKPPEIYIDLNSDQPIIIVSKLADLKWLNIIINSREMFVKLDQIRLRGSRLVNPEGMIVGNGNISYFTDVIYGAKPSSREYAAYCPSTAPYLDEIAKGSIVLVRGKDDSIIDQVLNYSKAKYYFSILRSHMLEVIDGAPLRANIVRDIINILRFMNYTIPTELSTLIYAKSDNPISLYNSRQDPDLRTQSGYSSPSIKYPQRPTVKDIVKIINTSLTPQYQTIRSQLKKKPVYKYLD